MKTILTVICLAVLLVGCAGDIKQVMDSQTVPTAGITSSYHANDKAFTYLNRKFREDNFFSIEEADTLETSQKVIIYVIRRVEARQQRGELSYAEVLYSYEMARDAYLDMRSVLDNHIDNYGAPVQVVYFVTRREVNRLIADVNNLLIAAESDLDSKTFDAMTGKLGDFVASLQPFVGALL